MADETKPKKADTVKVRVLRDFWGEENADGSENRCRAGEVLEMPVSAAFDAVEQGMVERVKAETMKIQHEGWTLYDYDPALKRQVWYIENPDGSTTWRTDYEVEPTIDINQAQRNMAQKGWSGDYHHIASIPLNILYDSGLAQAQAEGDDEFVSKWLNNIDNRAWRTKDGRV